MTSPDAERQHAAAEQRFRDRLADGIALAQALRSSDVPRQMADVALVVARALTDGHKVVFCGNGGSSMDAGHLAAELLGRYRYDRPSLPAISLPDSTAAMTAIANDYDYEDVFARQVRGLGQPGDVLVALSTSGNSMNVVRAVEAAAEVGMTTVVLTGPSDGKVVPLADHCVCVGSSDTPRVQEACMHLGHTVCELVEEALHPRPTG